jgi:prophage tail gpP-like protein
MKTQLLCTFTRQTDLEDVVNIIIECNDILYDKIYVFSNQNDSSQLICTYNVEYDDGFQEGIIDTISLHRKKQTNTLYTINALNEVIRSKNNGILDKKFMVDWTEFQNSLILTNETGLNIIPTKIFQIINVKEHGK